jgi:hypothetical protein
VQQTPSRPAPASGELRAPGAEIEAAAGVLLQEKESRGCPFCALPLPRCLFSLARDRSFALDARVAAVCRRHVTYHGFKCVAGAACRRSDSDELVRRLACWAAATSSLCR